MFGSPAAGALLQVQENPAVPLGELQVTEKVSGSAVVVMVVSTSADWLKPGILDRGRVAILGVVEEVRFLRRCGIAAVALRSGIEALGAVRRELRDGDRGQDTDDRDDDQKLDESETGLIGLTHCLCLLVSRAVDRPEIDLLDWSGSKPGASRLAAGWASPGAFRASNRNEHFSRERWRDCWLACADATPLRVRERNGCARAAGQKPADSLTVTFFDRHKHAADRVGDSIARSRRAIASTSHERGSSIAIAR